MTDDNVTYGAQVVLKRADGTSILDVQESVTASVLDKYRVPEDTVAAAARALEALGFRIAGNDGTTLSIEGSRQAFIDVFGLEVGAEAAGVAAHATQVPDEIKPYVADVIVPPGPTFF